MNPESVTDVELTRRQLLAGAVGGGATVGSGVAIYNVFLGYDRFTGTNLTIQDLDSVVSGGLSPSGEHVATAEDYRIEQHDGVISVRDDERIAEFDPAADDPVDAATVDDDLELEGGPLEELVADLAALEAGEVRFVYDQSPAFFDRLESESTRPFTASALRGRRIAAVDPGLVETFAGVDPADTRALVTGLAEGFREYSSYDVARYVAGSIEDNVIFGRRDLRRHFESPADFEALVAGENDGLFCTELTRRAMEAFHAIPAPEQTHPVFTGYVCDYRHKHYYLLLASVRRVDGELVIPVTFLDYMYSTLYDDFRVRWALGEGIEAYDSRHRADEIRWYG